MLGTEHGQYTQHQLHCLMYNESALSSLQNILSST